MAKRIRVTPGPVAFRYARQMVTLKQRGDKITLNMGDTNLMVGVVESQMVSLRDDVILQVAEAIQKGINSTCRATRTKLPPRATTDIFPPPFAL